ncbi:hypothetical protein [Gottfriedia solisilvae]|uniref:hypothetical protein n=1 Tax=Gottfriedia solisilvae TaxID=1516104 RepID=UPI003D2EAD7A
MEVIEKRKKLRTSRKIALFIIILLIVLNFSKIGSSVNKLFVQRTKKESAVTKTLTKDEMSLIREKQWYGLTIKYNKWNTQWLHKELIKGSRTLLNDYSFMLNHPEYDSVKIQFIVTRYKIDGKIVEFISESRITQVHSKTGWKDIKKN